DERLHHDEWAELTAVDDVIVDGAFLGPCAFEHAYILSELGDIRGKRILDLGAGLGESSVFFASRGAEVTAVDISPKMIEMTLRLAERHNVKVEGKVLSGESLALPENSYDIIYFANTLHHITERTPILSAVTGALREGGVFISIDPLSYNPLIN